MGQPGALLTWQLDYWGDMGLQTETPVAGDLEKVMDLQAEPNEKIPAGTCPSQPILLFFCWRIHPRCPSVLPCHLFLVLPHLQL